MKKLLLSMLVILMVHQGFSQKEIISLSFNAKDSITQNPLVLDSVYIHNITLGCDTSLYNPVTDLSINILHVGINDPESQNSASFTVMQNVPNPFSGSTLLRIYLKTDGALKLAVYDVHGKQLSEYHNRFVKGWHTFGVSTGGSQLMFLKVSDNTSAKTIKLLSTGAGTEGSRVFYNGQAGQDHPLLKSVQEETGFIFYLGNQLQFTAYADGYYESILTGNPESDETYTFAMLPVVKLPTVTTAVITNNTQTTATGGGEVTSDGGAIVTARGVCWSTSQNPTITDSYTSDGNGTGIFVSNLTGLTANTPYFVRAYAINSVGTAYGNEQTFATLPGSPCGQPITDTRDGKTYNTVLIGTQCWFAQNLNVGTKVLGSANQTNNSIIEKYCYNNLESNCDVYGGLYQWDEAMQYSTTEGVIGICPTGWHLPTDAEWTTLTTFLGGEAVAGGKMKETGLTHWAAPNTGATNSSGFTALPGGDRNGYYGNFENLTNYAFFWSSSQTDATGAWDRYLSDFSVTVGRDDTLKINSFSGRCIKD